MHDFYRRIQTVFREAGSNRHQFCRKRGHKYQTLQAYWNTDKLPPGDVLEDLAREYHVSLDALVLGGGAPAGPEENPIINRIIRWVRQLDEVNLLRIDCALQMFQHLLLSGSIASGQSILAALATGADMAYIGSAFIATKEANAVEGYKKMITECGARDIVHTNLITGVHGNYLKPSLLAAGLDPDNLPTSDPSKMDFGSNRQKPKAWKDIWGCGQGIGVLEEVVGAGELVDRFAAEYEAAREQLFRRVA